MRYGVNVANRNTAIHCAVLGGMPPMKTLTDFTKKNSLEQARNLCSREQIRIIGQAHFSTTEFKPDAFRSRKRQRMNAKKWNVLKANILATGLSGFHYVIHLKGLGLERYQESINIYDWAVIQEIKKVLSSFITGPYHVSLEVGEHHRLHIHIIASRQPNHDQMLEQGVIHSASEIFNDGWISYLCKPKVEYDHELAGEYILAQAILSKSKKKLPRTTWTANTTKKGAI
jgi:hypothetical protein